MNEEIIPVGWARVAFSLKRMVLVFCAIVYAIFSGMIKKKRLPEKDSLLFRYFKYKKQSTLVFFCCAL